MKFKNLYLISTLFFFSCTTGQVAQLANTVGVAYQDYASATTGTLTPTQIIASANLAYNDLSGIASLAQSYVGSGKTPTQATLQTGASILSLGTQIVTQLPNTPITQTTANTLYAAAAKVLTQPTTSKLHFQEDGYFYAQNNSSN